VTGMKLYDWNGMQKGRSRSPTEVMYLSYRGSCLTA
jgi:hypothetical protein